MYLLLIFTLIYSISVMGFGGRFLGISGVLFLSNFFMIITFIISCILFYETGLSSSTVQFKLWAWVDSEYLLLEWGFFFLMA